MPETCVLGHAWTPGRVLCAVCGFGPRAIQPGHAEPGPQREPVARTAGAQQASHASRASQARQAAPVSPAAPTPATAATGAGTAAVAGTAVRADPGPAPSAASYQLPPVPELVLSPDGQWAWDGTQWVPAPQQPETPPQADLLPTPTHRHGRRARRGRKDADAAVPDPTTPAGRRADPKVLAGLVLVVAIAAAADLALKLPPLGHKTASTSTPAVSSANTIAHQDAFAKSILRGGALTETSYRARSGLYTSSVAQLVAAGMPTVAAPAVFAAQAHHGTGFCLVAAANPRTRFFLYDSVHGGLSQTVFTTEAAALRGCSQH